MDAVNTFHVTCPYCGEYVEIFVEDDVRGTFVQDCEVCCNPWLVRVAHSADGPDISVGRGVLRLVQEGDELRITSARDLIPEVAGAAAVARVNSVSELRHMFGDTVLEHPSVMATGVRAERHV